MANVKLVSEFKASDVVFGAKKTTKEGRTFVPVGPEVVSVLPTSDSGPGRFGPANPGPPLKCAGFH